MRSPFLHRPSPQELDALGALRRFFIIWTPALIGILIIANESTPTFSSAQTSHWLRPIFERFFGPLPTQTWEQIHHLMRKTGHFIGYGTLCVFFLRAWLLTFARSAMLRSRIWRLKSWSVAIASTFSVASADELHQSFLPSRTGLFSDVVLDTCGGIALSGIVLALTWYLRRLRGPS